MTRAFRILAILTTASVTACTVAPGPVEQQAMQANIACQQGYVEACQTAAYLQPAASAERAQAQQQANVGTAVAAGIVGVAAGAAIASSSRPYYGRGYYGGGYYGRPYYRRW
ncbi:hypothetical protein [Roseococcus pinisoli]|uniref:Glycine zipper family protein n=1 Tax=Roseococcus pinisoli TaxID=2835040 RepID=A0ABS5QIW6_9PROT|nr:hypothetical protein [Roseococcus pinisoli]MBS7813591.1 hypothetical protein [Roseococcus pinisoli]